MPDVTRRAAIAPVRGQGLGSTMWNACAWWAIRCFLEGKDLREEQKRMLESLQLQFLKGLGEREWFRLELRQWV